MQNDLKNLNLSDDEIETLYLQHKAEKEKQSEDKRKAYEELRNSVVSDCIAQANEMSSKMKLYHSKMMPTMLAFGDLMREFGDMNKKSKGGFSIMSDDCNSRVTLHRRNIGEFNELADMAENHIGEFLERSIKTASANAYELIVTLLERKKGRIEYSRAMQILTYENKFDDADWKKGCELLRQSFVVTSSKYYLEFEVKNEEGAWERIDLNFASLTYLPEELTNA